MVTRLDYDLVVVGASLAGASLALSLVDEGLRVLLIDKACFPRRVACGEGLSEIGIKALEGILPSQKLLAIPHQEFYTYEVGSNRILELGDRKRIQRRGIGISRLLLDHVLLNEALRHQAIHFMSNARVTNINQDSNGCQLYLSNGGKAPITSRYVAIASGKGQSFTSALGFKTLKPRVVRLGLTATYQTPLSAPKLQMRVKVAEHNEVYCTPVGAGKINVNMLSTPEFIASLGGRASISKFFERTLEGLGVEAYQIADVIGSQPFGYSLTQAARGRVVVIGDALESLDPVGGMGMTHAITSARFAARAICMAFKQESIPDTFSSKIINNLKPLRQATAGAAFLVRTLSQRQCGNFLHRTGVIEAVEGYLLNRGIAWAKEINLK
jgi:menaquinone-9 beta-reductase